MSAPGKVVVRVRPVLRPGLRLHRDPAGRPALVEHDRVFALDEGTAVLLEALDGLLDETTLLRRHPGAASEAAWRRLREGGVVVDAEAATAPLRGLDPDARADALPETTALVAHDPAGAAACWRRRRAATVSVLGRGAVTDDLVALLTRAGVGNVQAEHDPAQADLTVLTHDHEPAADTVARLLRGGRPHLVVGVRGVDGVAGPLVLPGTTSCLRCVDLCRAGGDPGWAGLRDRLAAPAPVVGATAVPASAVTTALLAALAAADVLALLEGRTPATLGATVTVSLHRPLPAVRAWPTHPACGCTWDAHASGRGQWSA